ncbi:MAG: trypsin-like peptidase domain-containing protein, partial [Pseudomonadota bacterium]
MASSFFLHKTRIDPSEMIALEGGPALEQHAALSQFLHGRFGRGAADLFAEPVLSRGNGASDTTVSWYVSRGDDGVRLADLPEEERTRVEQSLSRTLAALAEGLSDPDFGPLLGAALHISDQNDIWSVAGTPVILGWGMAPAATMAAPAARDRHFTETLGAYLPLQSAPAIRPSEWRDRGYGTPSVAEAPAEPTADPSPAVAETPVAAPPVAPPPPPSAAGPESPPEESRWRWRWIAPIALFTLFAVLLILALLPGSLLYPPRPAPSIINESDIADATREANRALEQRIAELRIAIDGAVCLPSGDLALPDGFTPDGRQLPPLPGDGDPSAPDGTDPAPQQRADGPVQIRPDSLTPPPPAQLLTPGTDGADPANLLDMLDARTALVLASGPESSGHGTGFFIGPDLLVTNHHVIAQALNGGKVGVTNERLGQVTRADIVAHLGPLEQTGADFAILRIPGADMPFYDVALPDDSIRLQQVIAAGYPGFVLETDQQFQALLDGDSVATPGLVVTDGIVNAEQTIGPSTRVLIHTAHISPGNSGGP